MLLLFGGQPIFPGYSACKHIPAHSTQVDWERLLKHMYSRGSLRALVPLEDRAKKR